MKKILFILDRAHGKNVSGKASKDGQHVEWKWSERLINELILDLNVLNIPWKKTVINDLEPGLTKRVKIANQLAKNVEIPILLSFHNNAGGGHGIEIFTSPGEDESDIIAKEIATLLQVDFPECKWRKMKPNELDKEANFTILAGNKKVKPNYNGILIEFLFMDHPNDLKKLKDPNYTKRFKESILFAIYMLCKKYGYQNFNKEIIIT